MNTAEFIKKWEVCKLKAYQDGGEVWTIGWGHTGPEVIEGLVWTQEQADKALQLDIDHARNGVYRYVRVPLRDNQETALVSFTFNLGVEAFRKSRLLTFVNQSDHIQAALQLVQWHHDNGKKIRGLLRRRLAEASLYLDY